MISFLAKTDYTYIIHIVGTIQAKVSQIADIFKIWFNFLLSQKLQNRDKSKCVWNKKTIIQSIDGGFFNLDTHLILHFFAHKSRLIKFYVIVYA